MRIVIRTQVPFVPQNDSTKTRGTARVFCSFDAYCNKVIFI